MAKHPIPVELKIVAMAKKLSTKYKISPIDRNMSLDVEIFTANEKTGPRISLFNSTEVYKNQFIFSHSNIEIIENVIAIMQTAVKLAQKE